MTPSERKRKKEERWRKEGGRSEGTGHHKISTQFKAANKHLKLCKAMQLPGTTTVVLVCWDQSIYQGVISFSPLQRP